MRAVILRHEIRKTACAGAYARGAENDKLAAGGKTRRNADALHLRKLVYAHLQNQIAYGHKAVLQNYRKRKQQQKFEQAERIDLFAFVRFEFGRAQKDKNQSQNASDSLRDKGCPATPLTPESCTIK